MRDKPGTRAPLYYDEKDKQIATLQSQLTEVKAVSDRWQKDCRWYQEQYADCATELKEVKAELEASRECHRLAANYGAKQWLRATALVDAARASRENLMAVLCDPEGNCCIEGSEMDRQLIDDALAKLIGGQE